MTTRICLSSLTIKPQSDERLVCAGPWCHNSVIKDYFQHLRRPIEVAPSRELPEQQYRSEAEECFRLYKKYVRVLASELNRLHSTNYSIRYWETLLSRFLYPLTATVIDKYAVLVALKERWPDSVVDVASTGLHLANPHTSPSFGASRLLHLLVYSVIVVTTKILPSSITSDEQIKEAITAQGDGKKDLRSTVDSKNQIFGLADIKKRIWWLLPVIRALKRLELPFGLIRKINPGVIALGNQYLKPRDFASLMIRARRAPFYFSSDGWGKLDFEPYDPSRRDVLKFPMPVSQLEESLQACIRKFLPTVFIENFIKARQHAYEMLPKSPKLILNSQHHVGGEAVDFFIAHSVEDRGAEHMMVCHGGCYGAMEVSVQEQIWARFSDVYALWSNPRNYGAEARIIKLPSLRFHKWLDFPKKKKSGRHILVLTTGHYPQRYAYNSIYPYTIDDEYEAWQRRFLSQIDIHHQGDIVIRDYHRSFDISSGNLRKWLEDHGFEMDVKPSLKEALQDSKIVIQTVPQTTYLETLTADHPTLCFWNPEANLIRADLVPYFEGLVRVGILHRTPESASRKLNEIASDPLQWWNSHAVRAAVGLFRENVCHTSKTGLTKWAKYIGERGRK